MRTLTDYEIESLISRLLKVGIALSSIIVILGGVLFLLHEGDIPVKYHIFLGEPDYLKDLGDVERSALEGQPVAIIQWGVILLIATPIARELLCFIGFLLRGEWKFVFITLFTSLLLLISFFGLFA